MTDNDAATDTILIVEDEPKITTRVTRGNP